MCVYVSVGAIHHKSVSCRYVKLSEFVCVSGLERPGSPGLLKLIPLEKYHPKLAAFCMRTNELPIYDQQLQHSIPQSTIVLLHQDIVQATMD